MKHYFNPEFFVVEEEAKAYLDGCLDVMKSVKEHGDEEVANKVCYDMNCNIRDNFGLPTKVMMIGSVEAVRKCEACGSEENIEIHVIAMTDVEANGATYTPERDSDGRWYIEAPEMPENPAEQDVQGK